ncbi:MAG TPA: hypothetical protein VFF88_04000 [Methylocella sp.]|nr:hypothetical protein [Methylocella sp.]
MCAFDYGVEAGLYMSKGRKFRQNALAYKRFSRAAEAIRFAMEELPSRELGGCSLEIGEDRYAGAAIRELYESVDFPLPRGRAERCQSNRMNS